MSSFIYSNIIKIGLRTFSNRKDLNVLDFGCGSGNLLEYFPKDKIGKYVGVDINKESLMNAKSKYRSHKFNFRQIQKDYSLGSKDSIDLIFAVGVLQYLDNSEINYFLKEARRVLRKSGMIILSCAVDHAIYRILNLYGLFLPHRFIKRRWLSNLIERKRIKIYYEKESGIFINPVFSHNLVLLFDLIDKIFFRTKGRIGPVGRFTRELFSPILYLEFHLPLDYGYTLILAASKV